MANTQIIDMDWFYERKLGKYLDLFQLAGETAMELGNPADAKKVMGIAAEAEEMVMGLAVDRLPGEEHAMERLMLFCAVGLGMLKTCSDIADAVAFGFELAEIEEEYGFSGESGK